MSLVQRSYKFKFNPTPAQILQLKQDFGCVRWVWNWAMIESKKTYDTYLAEEKRLNPDWVRPKPKKIKKIKAPRGESVEAKAAREAAEKAERIANSIKPPVVPEVPKSISFVELSRRLTQLKKTEEFTWLKNAASTVLTQKLMDLDEAYTRFYKQISKHPRLKKRRWEQSARYAIDPRIVQNLWIPGEKLQLPILGNVSLVWSQIPKGIPKMATVKQTADGKYWVSVSVEEEVKEFEKTGKVGALDVGLTCFLVDDQGRKVKPPKAWKKNLRNLKRAQRLLSRRTKGSKRWHNQRVLVATIHARIANIRKDFLQKLTTQLIREYDVIFVEDLNIKGMMQNRRLAASIADVGWGEFFRQLQYKAGFYGKTVVPIGRYEPTTKKCSKCGTIHPMKLSDRRMICGCGLNMDRDHNAAINIYRAGLVLQTVLIEKSPATRIGI